MFQAKLVTDLYVHLYIYTLKYIFVVRSINTVKVHNFEVDILKWKLNGYFYLF